MTFAKPTIEKSSEFDSESKLMCSVYGCPNRWSVQMGGSKPMCSAHQWANPEHYAAITGRILARNMSKTDHQIANYYEPKDEF
jgi:hypothetical protein